MNKFQLIKFWKKSIPLFNMLNQNVLFHEVIKKTSANCTIIPQKNVNRENRKDYLAPLLGDDAVDFLEFGVFKGHSIFGVAKLNTNPNSRFFGFDAFDEGYPEGFDQHLKGDYATSIPQTDDKRIKFVKGKFQDSLDDFLKSFEPKSRLVVHLDADLYSATLYVLTKLDKLFDIDTILTFDEFGRLNTEFRAFLDYTLSYYRDYEIIQHTPGYNRVSIKLTKYKNQRNPHGIKVELDTGKIGRVQQLSWNKTIS